MRVLAVIATFGLGGCGLAVGLGDYQLDGDPAGSGGSVPTGGAPPACTTAEDCTPVDVACRTVACEAGECVLDFSVMGTPCSAAGGDQCDGNGACIKDNGKGCRTPLECTSNNCIDGVCCESECVGPCVACDLVDSEGACSNLPTAVPDDSCLGAICDGSGACAVGADKWGLTIFDDGDQFVHDFTMDADGNTYAVGYLNGSIMIGNNSFTSDGNDPFVVKHDPNGNHLYSNVFNNPGDQRANAIAVDADGNMWIVGEFITSDVNFGTGVISNGGSVSIFAIKLSPAGDVLYAADFFESNAIQRPTDVAIDSLNNVWIVGHLEGSVNFGGGALSGPDPNRDAAFIVKLNAGGLWQMSDVFGGTLETRATNVAVDDNDDVVMVGELRSTVNFGGADLIGAAGNNPDVFIAKYDIAGVHEWSHAYVGGSGYKVTEALDVDPVGNIAFGGRFETSINFGGGELQSVGNGEDMFLAKLGPDGAHLFSMQYGDVADDGAVEGVAFDALGNLIVIGDYEGDITFGGPTFSNPTTADDIAVFKLAADNTHLWSRQFGDVSSQFARGIAVHRDTGNIAFAGEMDGEIKLGLQTLVAGGQNLFVICMGP
jgi:hypothetical protein